MQCDSGSGTRQPGGLRGSPQGKAHEAEVEFETIK